MPITFKVSDIQEETVALARYDYHNKHSLKRVKNFSTNTILCRSDHGTQNEYQKKMVNVNGFVNALCRAYCKHHHIIIRPDDVWIAIMVQFSAYVSNNAEKLRHLFVPHSASGKLNVEVRVEGDLLNGPYDQLTLMMADKLKSTLLNVNVCDWVIPDFSTTTHNDRVVGASVLMSTMKKYFNYQFGLDCGLTRVTLEGSIRDWENIELRAQRLLEFDIDGKMNQWCKMLHPVLQNFTSSAKGKPDVQWWNRVCTFVGGDSGPTSLSGWITSFCVYDKDGQWIGSPSSDDQSNLWPVIDTDFIARGWTSVDIQVDVLGDRTYQCEMFAGHMSYVIPTDNNTTIKPFVEWIVKLKTDVSKSENEEIIKYYEQTSFDDHDYQSGNYYGSDQSDEDEDEL